MTKPELHPVVTSQFPGQSLTGKRSGYWVIGKEARRQGKNIYYLCTCTCEEANTKEVERWILLTGQSQSCGCLRKEKLIASPHKAKNYQRTKETMTTPLVVPYGLARDFSDRIPDGMNCFELAKLHKEPPSADTLRKEARLTRRRARIKANKETRKCK